MICPFCAEEIKDQAIKCKHCLEFLDKSNANADERPSSQPQKASKAPLQKSINFPIELKKLSVYENHLIYAGKTFDYQTIESLSYQQRRDSINGVPTGNRTTFMIKNSKDGIIKISVNTGVLFQKNKKLLPEIFKYIFSVTYENILKKYLYSLTQNGYFNYEYRSEIGALGAIGSSKIARIYSNGNIVVGDKVVNLQIAKEKGVLQLGTEYGYCLNGFTRPHEIAISEKKGMFSGRILKINAEWDTQIIFSIIKTICEGKKF